MSATYYTEPGGQVVDAPKPFRERVPVRAVVWGALAGLVVLALGEWQFVAPLAEERDALRVRFEALAAENRGSEATLAGYDEFLMAKAEVDRRFHEATAAIPTSEQLPSVLNDVEGLTDTSNVHLVSFIPEAPGSTDVPGAASSAAAAGAATDRPDLALGERSIRVVVQSNYRDFEVLMRDLSTFPRLLTVNRFSARTTGGATEFTMEVGLGITAYYKDAPAAASDPLQRSPGRGAL